MEIYIFLFIVGFLWLISLKPNDTNGSETKIRNVPPATYESPKITRKSKFKA